jgi:uncharacterized protein (TIGR03435 family)
VKAINKLSHDLPKFSEPYDGLQTMDHFCDVIQSCFALNQPVVDQTGLEGLYAITVDWPVGIKAPNFGDPDFEERAPKWSKARDEQGGLKGFSKAIHDQLGLELVPLDQPIELLVVEKVH